MLTERRTLTIARRMPGAPRVGGLDRFPHGAMAGDFFQRLHQDYRRHGESAQQVGRSTIKNEQHNKLRMNHGVMDLVRRSIDVGEASAPTRGVNRRALGASLSVTDEIGIFPKCLS